MFTFDQERAADAPAISNLLDNVFGLDRHNKASYALRRNASPIAPLCQVVRESGKLVASIRFWPIHIRDMITDDGHNALLLGPLAVAPRHHGSGVGSRLMKLSLQRAEALGHQRILLVGEMCFYRRFGFMPTLPSCITLPGGRDARRLLVKQPAILPSLPAVGKVEAVLNASCHVAQTELAIAS